MEGGQRSRRSNGYQDKPKKKKFRPKPPKSNNTSAIISIKPKDVKDYRDQNPRPKDISDQSKIFKGFSKDTPWAYNEHTKMLFFTEI